MDIIINGSDYCLDLGGEESRPAGTGKLTSEAPASPSKIVKPSKREGIKLNEKFSNSDSGKESAVGGSMIDGSNYIIVTVHRLDGSFVGNGFVHANTIILLRHYFDDDTTLLLNVPAGGGTGKSIGSWQITLNECVQSDFVDEFLYISKRNLSGLHCPSTKKGFICDATEVTADSCSGVILGYKCGIDGTPTRYISPGDIVCPVHDYIDVSDARGDHCCDTERGCCGSVVVWAQDGKHSAIGLHCYGGSTGSNASRNPNGYIPFGPKVLSEIRALN